jgi:hypothetical protein
MYSVNEIQEIVRLDLLKNRLLQDLIVHRGRESSDENPPVRTTNTDPRLLAHPFYTSLPVLSSFEYMIRDWLDDYEPAAVWIVAAKAYAAATGRTDFVQFVLGSLTRTFQTTDDTLDEVTRARLHQLSTISMEQRIRKNPLFHITIATETSPLDIWLIMADTLDVPELWSLVMLHFILEEEESGFLHFSLTTKDATNDCDVCSDCQFVQETCCFYDRFHQLTHYIHNTRLFDSMSLSLAN